MFPWLFSRDLRHGPIVKAAFSEFHAGRVTLDSEAYQAPNAATAHAMLGSAAQLVQHSANGIEATRVVGTAPEPLGAESVLLTGPGLNGEGAQAVMWRDGSLVGTIGVDGENSHTGMRLAEMLAQRQESIYLTAVRQTAPSG